MIFLEEYDYRRITNLHSSADNGEYYYALTNLLQLCNSVNNEDIDDTVVEDLSRLEKEYKLVRKIYENEREKSQIFMDTCNNVMVVKIYKSKEALEEDNYSEGIKIDPEFETLHHDMEIYNKILSESDTDDWDDEKWKSILSEKMREYYIFCNTTAIEHKINNILKNRELNIKIALIVMSKKVNMRC